MRRAEIKQRLVSEAQDDLLQAALSWHRHSDGVYDLQDQRLKEVQEHIQISADVPESWPLLRVLSRGMAGCILVVVVHCREALWRTEEEAACARPSTANSLND